MDINSEQYRAAGDTPSAQLPIFLDLGSQTISAQQWMGENQETVHDAIADHGAVLFRNTGISSPETFERFCTTLTPDLASYVGGGSPRTRISGGVYTSTEYVSRVSIPLHCEASYLQQMPSRLWFYCHQPSDVGGRTPIGDMRRVAARLDPDLVDRFRKKGLLYVMNMSARDGFGKTWCDTYETQDRDVAERRVRDQGHECEWTGDGTLRVLMRQAAERAHPTTGAPIWVNQAVNWHAAHLGMDRFRSLERVYGAQINFPKSVLFDDGTEIDIEDILAIQNALATEEVRFDWRQGDVLLLDNNLISHGREPFRGERKVFVALAE